MSVISLIAAVDTQWGLGKENHLLCHLPADLQYFKANTLHKPVIMGRKTWESIGRPLPDRINIVISRQNLALEGAKTVNSLQKALELVQYEEEIMIIGGGSIFAKALPLANRLYLTRIHHQFDADTFFPKPDWKVWKKVRSEVFHSDAKNAWDMTFEVYERQISLDQCSLDAA